MEYEDQIQSDKVDLVYPPILDDFNSNNITFYNETGRYILKFLYMGPKMAGKFKIYFFLFGNSLCGDHIFGQTYASI